MGALWAAEEFAGAFQPSDHGTTQGGNPLACAACAAVFGAIEKEDLVTNGRDTGSALTVALEANGHPVIRLDFHDKKDLGQEFLFLLSLLTRSSVFIYIQTGAAVLTCSVD